MEAKKSKFLTGKYNLIQFQIISWLRIRKISVTKIVKALFLSAYLLI